MIGEEIESISFLIQAFDFTSMLFLVFLQALSFSLFLPLFLFYSFFLLLTNEYIF